MTKPKFMCKTAILGLAISSLMLSEMVTATEIKWNGFLNATGNISDSKTAYLGNINENGSFDSTTFGFAGAARINAKVSVAGQLHMSEGGVEYDWGYANYRFSDSSSFKAGRMKYPNGLVSETFDIGVTNIWVRPPESIYGDTAELMFEGYNGAAFNFVTGDEVEFSSEFYLGDIDTPDGTEELKKTLGLVLKLESESYTLKLAGSTATLITSNPALPRNNKSKTSLSFGADAQFDIGRIMFEYVNSSVSSNPNSDIDAWYLTLSHTFDTWTPHFTYQSYETVTGGAEQTSYTLGINKQLDPSVVLKMEYQNVDPTNGGLFDAQPADSTVNFINLSMNMVF
ncbi:hypothetical protein MNBD_GAMMA09-2799 [hydrothermal vent metagenome]|uniref:Porin domain-containing protein n=1 Tax=hydrothermal vent metagenome TaxID=652676 RepID=A0A3B0XUI7_9ZZZZ